VTAPDQYSSVRFVVVDVQAAIDLYTDHVRFRLNPSVATAFAGVVRGPPRLLRSGPASSRPRRMTSRRVNTVLARASLRELPLWAPAGSCLSYPPGWSGGRPQWESACGRQPCCTAALAAAMLPGCQIPPGPKVIGMVPSS
jgi:hypothetical protein